ncbi:MAG: hypothetical protein AB7F89_24580, partial [Pirellulaceae bacterium]
QGEQQRRHNRQTYESSHLPISFADQYTVERWSSSGETFANPRRPDPSEGNWPVGRQACPQ